MTYVWELAINAPRRGIEPASIMYKFDDEFSPYIELSFTDINEPGIPQIVHINPYQRYYSVFKTLLNPNLSLNPEEFRRMLLDIGFIRRALADEVFRTLIFPNVTFDEKEYRDLLANDEFIRSHVISELRQNYLEDERYGQKYLHDEKISRLRHRDLKADSPEIVDAIFDITVHHLIDIDVYMGMNMREYYINFIIQDMHHGYFGSHVQNKIAIFTRDEQVVIANNLVGLYTMSEEIFLLKESVRRIFKGSYIFSNAEERDEVVFYLRTEKTPVKEEKMELLQYLFLPFKCACDIYWDQIFGIIDVPEMMVTGEMMQY